MQEHFEPFPALPQELQVATAHHLPNSDLGSVARIAKHYAVLFQTQLAVRYLLHGVTRGEHDEVRAHLKQNIGWLVQRGWVTDCSGREFKSISAFEYTLWALDKHLWTTLIHCIPEQEAHPNLWRQLGMQYQHVKTQGVTYVLEGKTITESHFDFKNTLIAALQTQVDLYQAPGAKDFERMDTQWRQGVGSAQKLLPMHVVAEYCSEESFSAVPQFIAPPTVTKGILNGSTKRYEPWFAGDSKLGVRFAVSKGSRPFAARTVNALGWLLTQGATRDLAAMRALHTKRTQDFIDLQGHLEHAITQEPQQTPPI